MRLPKFWLKPFEEWQRGKMGGSASVWPGRSIRHLVEPQVRKTL
jgi:hypothetical protein